MSRKAIRNIILVLTGVCMLSFLSGCGNKIRNLFDPDTPIGGGGGLLYEGTEAKGMTIADDAEIVKMSYHYSATYIGGMYSYTFERTEEGMQLSVIYNCINDDDPEVAILSDEDADKLMDILRRNDVGAWDGFSMRAKDVLDGDGFSFSAEFSDGSTISASGTNADPPNRSAVGQELGELVQPYIYDFLVEKEIIYVEPVYYPIEYGVATSYYYCGDYVSRLRTCHLTKEDAEKYPEIAAALEEINMYAQENFSETKSELVDIIRCDTNIFSAALYEYDPQTVNENGKGVYGRIVSTVNIKTEYGTRLTYVDMLRGPREDLMRSIRNEIHADYNEISIEELDPYYEEWLETENCEKLKFTIGANWLTVYFNPGEIADEKFGLIQVAAAYASQFYYASEVFKHPANYTEQICQPIKIMGNMTTDKADDFDTITLTLSRDQGKMDMYYVHLEDGHTYLYTDGAFHAVQDFPDDEIYEGDTYRLMYVYNLEKGNLEEVACYDNCFGETDINMYDAKDRDGVGNGTIIRKAPVDPMNILLDGDGDYKNVVHKVGDNGELVEIEN